MEVKRVLAPVLMVCTVFSYANVGFTKENNNFVPFWACEALDEFVAKGIVQPLDKGSFSTRSDLMRDEIAFVVAKTLMRAKEKNEYEKNEENLSKLKTEFAPELKSMGYMALESLEHEVETNSRPELSTEENFVATGEVRYNYVINQGTKRFDINDSRLRARFYFDYRLNSNWHLYSMLESDKSFLNSKSYNGSITGDRFYLKGKTGSSNVTVGSFGYKMADGNIYDSRFKGIKVDVDAPLNYTFAYGEGNEISRAYIATAKYKDYDYSVSGGWYNFEMENRQKNTIWTIDGTYDFEALSLGAMYLHSRSDDNQGDGYVLTLSHGKIKSRIPKTYHLFVKYYDQDADTYVRHTMSGLGGRMNGFKGYGAGYYYTLAENLVYGIEYYDLKNKVNGERGSTMWNQITYYF